MGSRPLVDAPDVAELSRISVFGCCGAVGAAATGGAVLSVLPVLSEAFEPGVGSGEGGVEGVVGEPGELVPGVVLGPAGADAGVLDEAGVDGEPGALLEEPGAVEVEPGCGVCRCGADGVGEGVDDGGFAGTAAGTLSLGTGAGVVVVCGIPEADLGSADGGV